MDSEVLSENRGLQRWCVMVRAVGVRRGLCGVVVSVLLVLSLGGCSWFDLQKQRQIAFLKAHESELVNRGFASTGALRSIDIRFDWNSVEVESAGLFLPEPYGLSLKVTSTSIAKGKTYQDRMIVRVDVEKLDKITGVSFEFSSHKRIG